MRKLNNTQNTEDFGDKQICVLCGNIENSHDCLWAHKHLYKKTDSFSLDKKEDKKTRDVSLDLMHK